MSDGLVINVSYDSSVNNAPAAFKTVVASVVQYYESIFTNPITLNIDVGYGEIDGEKLGSGDLGESEDTDQSFSYAQIRNALVANATSANQLQAVSTLPTTSPVSGSFSISLAEATALGLISGSTTLDGYVGFSSTTSFAYNDSNGVPAGEYDLYGDVAHEISEVMGRISDVDTGTTSVMDLYRYSASGVRALSNHQSTAYFSINGGATDLANFNTNPEGDYGDWASSVGNDAYLAFSNSGVVNPVSQTDLTVMNVLGYDLAIAGSAPTVTAIAEQPSTGELAAGKTVIVTLDFSEAVTVSGTPTLTLNDKGTATYTGGTGSSALAFSYTVAASDASVASLAATTVNLNGGAIQDSLGNNAALSLTGLTQTGPQIDNDANFVQQLYETVLLRQPDPGGLSAWTSALASNSVTRGQVVADFVGSAEAQDLVLPIVRLYQAFFDRAPDPGGLSAWMNVLRSGTPLAVVATDFASSPEFQQDFPAGTSPTSFVTDLYETILARAPDSGGEQNWVSFLTQDNDSAAAQATVVLDFANSQEFINDSTGPIDAWLTAAGSSGTYPATIAYPTAPSTALMAQAIASSVPAQGSVSSDTPVTAPSPTIAAQQLLAPAQHA